MLPVNRAFELSVEDVLVRTVSKRAGLSSDEAKQRLDDGGENSLATEKSISMGQRFIRQLADPMVLVLLAAASVSALLGAWTDSVVIATVIALNAALALVQEGRAARAADALNSLTSPQARVRRDGRLLTVEASELVVGDIVLVEAGDVVAADLRLLEAFALTADESALTGESASVEKSVSAAMPDAPLAERSSMLFMGAAVVTGRGEGVVTACGMDTQMGCIARLLRQEKAPLTPLQRRLAELSRVLSIAVLVICALIFLLTMTRSNSSLLDAFMLAVSLAVAAVPEGLVVVVTLVLTLGMNAMSHERAIIRRLSAVETLGAVQVICSDKTGTLTENVMRVTDFAGYAPLLAETAALCSSVRWDASGDLSGDPTEVALAQFAAAHEQPRPELNERYRLINELPFDSERKLMSTLHTYNGGKRQYTKGAFERVLERSQYYVDEMGSVQRLNAAERRRWQERAENMAANALRVLAAAYRDSDELVEQGLVLIGLWGLSDPPRREAREAVAAAARAGVITVMASGDNLATATAIARELGILQRGERAISGDDLMAMSESELRRDLARIRVYARVRPEDKLRIVRAWQQKGCITAMTGDGVNDAPALAAADIGVGMGQAGTEVSRRAAALVLADDNYATIIAAIREGRRIYENIRRAVQFLLSANFAEVVSLTIASVLGWQLFLPIHLLWINLMTDCLPAAALGLEQAEPEVMDRPPRNASDSLFAGGMGWAVLRQGTVLALLTLISFLLGGGGTTGVSMAFITLSAGELFHAWNMRSRNSSIFTLPTANHRLTFSMLLCFALDLLLLYLPSASALFSLVPLTPLQLLQSALLAFAIVPWVELEKKIKTRIRAGSYPLTSNR